MKRVISILLCLTMVFVVASVPALAADGEGEWVEVFGENFTNFEEGFSFDTATSKDLAIELLNAKAYSWYDSGNSAKYMKNTVASYSGDKAFKISRATANKGDRRILFELNNHLSGQVEISFRLLATAVIDNGINVEIFGENADGTVNTGGMITGSTFYSTYAVTKYNNNKTYGTEENAALSPNDWITITYLINTESGAATVTYKSSTVNVERKITGQGNTTAVTGLGVRGKNSYDIVDIYVDDISVKYLEPPAAAKSEFDFSKIANGNESEAKITKSLDLMKQYTDSENKVWNIAWSSSDASVINPDTGAISPSDKDKEVTLTAVFTSGGKSFSKTFTVTVAALLSEFDFSDISSESVNGVTSNLNLISEFTDNSGITWKVSWISSNNGLINQSTGAVAGGALDERVILTAKLTNVGSGGETEVTVARDFNVKVLAAGAYSLREGFDVETPGIDYSQLNAIEKYKGDGTTSWGVANNYKGDDTAAYELMNANISVDPENSNDKVLKLWRSAETTSKSTIQRVWTETNKEAAQLNDKVYVGMRILREKNALGEDIYFYDAAEVPNRLGSIRFRTDNKIEYTKTYNSSTGKFGNDTSTVAAPAGEWFDLEFAFDMKNDLYNFYINGVVAGSGNIRLFPSEAGFGGLMFDLARGDAATETLVYVDDMTVRTTSGMPYSVVSFNFTDKDGYPTHSTVENGCLESLTMRKMSAVDEGTNPKLYVCFFEGESLYDVVTAPIAEASPLGTFDVTLNKALPKNPLNYNIKAFVLSGSIVPLMNVAEHEPYAVVPTIYVAGDSIGRKYSANEYPMSGYAQQLSANFEEGSVEVVNYAESGRSSKSFIGERGLVNILGKITSGDYLLIQFGHNDDKPEEYRNTSPDGVKGEDGSYTEGSYQYYIMQYVDGARSKGAIPVLLTPPSRNLFDSDGKMYDKNLIKYVNAMRNLAADENILIVDLYDGWTKFVDGEVAKGIDSRNFYSYFYANDARFAGDPAYEGVSKYDVDSTHSTYTSLFSYTDDDDPTNDLHRDGSHLNVYGAKVAAKIIADCIKELNVPISDSVLEDRAVEWVWGEYATFNEPVTD